MGGREEREKYLAHERIGVEERVTSDLPDELLHFPVGIGGVVRFFVFYLPGNSVNS
jgi:hypothetical protein